MIKTLNILILTMLGIGKSKYAPGTVASFITCLIYVWFYSHQINILYLIFGVFTLFVFSVYSIDVYENSFSNIDDKEIVIDEFIGQSVPVLTIYNFIEKNDIVAGIFSIVILLIIFFITDNV